MAVRNVMSRSSRKFRVKFPSKKLNRMVACESLLELDAALHFEFSPGIVSFQEQPAMIHYEHDGATRRYFPDFELVMRNGEVVYVEVKPKTKLSSPQLASKLTAIGEHYNRKNQRFLVLTDAVLRQQPRLNNLRLLARVQHCKDDLKLPQIVARDLLENGQQIPFSKLSEQLGNLDTLRLLASGHICCEIDLYVISEHCKVRLSEGADHDAILI